MQRMMYESVAVAALMVSAGVAGAASYSDGDFSGWTSSTNNPASTNAFRDAGFGNPAASIYAETRTDIFDTDVNVVWLSDFSYDPSATGVALSIGSMSIDWINTSTNSFNGQLFSFAVAQGGKVYQTINTNFALVNGQWNTTSDSNLGQNNFGEVNNLSSHPDFSTSGGAVRFGLIAYNFYDPSFGDERQEVHYDNFSMSYTPAPSGVAVGGLGAIAMLRRRR